MSKDTELIQLTHVKTDTELLMQLTASVMDQNPPKQFKCQFL